MQSDGHMGQERRRRRSNDVMTALHYQLSLSQKEGGFEALVLVDDRGCLVAGAGAWPTCEMLAAYAPFLAHREERTTDALADRLRTLQEGVEVETLSVDGSEALLCARGGGSNKAPAISHAAAGCQRILCLRDA